MAKITGYTAERMKQIEDTTVVGGHVNTAGNLILIRRNNEQINAGSTIGPEGPTGPPMSFGGYREPLLNLGNVSGTVSLNFATHNVWFMNPTGTVTINFQNLPATNQISSGTLIVGNGDHAISWPALTRFPDGTPPEIAGETVLSILARSGYVILGTAWKDVY